MPVRAASARRNRRGLEVGEQAEVAGERDAEEPGAGARPPLALDDDGDPVIDGRRGEPRDDEPPVARERVDDDGGERDSAQQRLAAETEGDGERQREEEDEELERAEEHRDYLSQIPG